MSDAGISVKGHVQLGRQLKTETASVGTADRFLSEPLDVEGERHMADNAISPSVPQHTLSLINDTKDAPAPFWFVRTPRIVRKLATLARDSDITQVYCVLAEEARADGLCIITHAEIADLSGISIRKVGTVLRALSKTNIITVERRRSINFYTLVGPHQLPAEETLPGLYYAADSADSAGDSAGNDIVDSAGKDIQVGTKRHVTRQETTSDSANSADIRSRKTSKTVKTSKTEPAERKPNPTFELWRRWADRIGIPATARPQGKESGQAKMLVEQGLTPDQAMELFEWLAADSYWASKGVDLGVMLTNVGKWRAVKATAAPPPPAPNDPVAKAKAEKARLEGFMASGNWHEATPYERQAYTVPPTGAANYARKIAGLNKIIDGAVEVAA